MDQDKSINNLLDLNDEKFIIDEKLGLWVKFEAKIVSVSKDRPHGIKYSLTLHDRSNKRILGFDNAHAIEFGRKKNVAQKKSNDHWHRNENDDGRPYEYIDAEKLLTDFWNAVDKKIREMKEA